MTIFLEILQESRMGLHTLIVTLIVVVGTNPHVGVVVGFAINNVEFLKIRDFSLLRFLIFLVKL